MNVKRMVPFLVMAVVAVSAMAAEPQRYLLGTDEIAPQKAPTIKWVGSRLIVTKQVADGRWIKHTLTPTDEHLYGPFGEPVVVLTAIVPHP